MLGCELGEGSQELQPVRVNYAINYAGHSEDTHLLCYMCRYVGLAGSLRALGKP